VLQEVTLAVPGMLGPCAQNGPQHTYACHKQSANCRTCAHIIPIILLCHAVDKVELRVPAAVGDVVQHHPALVQVAEAQRRRVGGLVERSGKELKESACQEKCGLVAGMTGRPAAHALQCNHDFNATMQRLTPAVVDVRA